MVESDEWDGQESWTLKGAQADCEADFTGWHEDILTYIRSIDVHYRWALLSRPTLQSWHAGRTVLLGDACHPMLPFMAQGAAMAIEDGLILARAIDESGADLDHAIQTYERNRITRANKCVEASEKNRELFHNSQLNNEADAQAYVDRQWDKDAIFARYEWLFAYDPVHADLAAGVH